MRGREKQRTLLVCPLVGPFYLSSVDQMVGGWGGGGVQGEEKQRTRLVCPFVARSSLRLSAFSSFPPAIKTHVETCVVN